jgi:hypothetical protein
MMKKGHKPKHRKLLFMAVIIVLLVAGAYLFRGWLRHTVAPGVVAQTAGRQVQKTTEEQYSKLNNPFTVLGMTSVKHENKCRLLYAKSFHAEVDCTSSYSSYSDKVSSLKPDLGQRAALLENYLKANGWTGGNTTISALGANISKGIDYTPDAAYQKTVGKITCLADFNTAYSKPKPAAIAGSVECSRTFYLFGAANQDYKLQIPK